jgi:hypothetical protein
MNGDYSITANFVRQYDLTTSNTEGGLVTAPGEGVFTYDTGMVVSLVATPTSGYRFGNWTGNVGTIANVNAAATNITMNGDYSITANFIRQYNLTTSGTAGGTVTTPGVGTRTYDAGTVVNLVAIPDAGYRFVEWTGDVGTIADVNAASTNITMNGDYSITANFVRQYNLTTSGTAGGTVTTPGVGTRTYDAGTDQPGGDSRCWLPVWQLDRRCRHHCQCQCCLNYHYHERRLCHHRQLHWADNSP